MSYKFSKAFLILQMKTHVPMTDIRQFTCNPFEEHAYLVSDGSGAAVLFDPGFLGGEETSALDALLQKEGLRLQAVLLTHAHFDHIYGVKHCIGRYGTPVYLHPGEAPVLQGDAAFAAGSGMPAPDTDWAWIPVRDGEVLRFGEMAFEVIATPGHSPGGVCYFCREEGQLFSGDTLFAGTIGNTQLPWADYDDLIVSVMEKLMGLDSGVEVHPGHGGGTTIGYERTHNPFLQPFNEKDPETGRVDGIEMP